MEMKKIIKEDKPVAYWSLSLNHISTIFRLRKAEKLAGMLAKYVVRRDDSVKEGVYGKGLVSCSGNLLRG